MKRLPLSGALLGLTVLLGACSGTTPPSSATFSLTVKLDGVTSAPVTVTNTTTSTQVFSGTLEGSKTFGSLKAGDVLRVEGGAVNAYTAPAVQSVTLDASKTVTLAYAQAGATVSADRVAGKISGNTLKIARVILNASTQPPFGVADVDATNSFDLDLSGQTPPAGGFYLLTEGCTATGANTNPTARVWGNSVFDAYGSQGDHLGTVEERVISGTGSLAPQTRILRMYALADTTFQGTCSFDSWYGSTPFSEDYDVTLKAGWNAVAVTESGNHYVYRNVGGDTRTELRFFSAEPGVSVSLNPATLTFNNDDAVTVDAQFTQVGGYSGTVTLKTDDPNLTVEPSTLTLPALTAQAVKPEAMGGRLAELGLSPQSLTQKLTFRYTGSENTSRSFALNVLDASGNRVGDGYGSLMVDRPGIRMYTYASSELEVTPNSSVKLPVQLSSVGGFSGVVTLRLEGLPDGVTANTQTVNLGGYTSTELTLSGGAAPTPGEYTATLVAEGGGHSTRSDMKITVPKPSVTVRVNAWSYNNLGVYQGSTGNVEVTVWGNAGFSGNTTLTLTDLPAGVSAPPISVQVTPSMTTVARIPVTAAADATLGSTVIRVSSSDLKVPADSTGDSAARFRVMPARTTFTRTSSLAATGEGVWGVREETNYWNPGPDVLVLSNGQNSIREIALPLNFAEDTRIASGPDGTLWVYGFSNSSYKPRVGVVLPSSNTVTVFDLTGGAIQQLVVDGDGRAYISQSNSSSSPRTLRRITTSGEVSTVIGVNPGAIATNVNGTKIFSLEDARLSQIDVQTDIIVSQELPSISASNIAVTVDGSVWLYDYNGYLTRVNTDGSLSVLPTYIYGSGPLFADRTQNVLYIGARSSSDDIFRVDTITGQSTLLPLKIGTFSSNTLMPAFNGGLWAAYSDYSNNTSVNYLARLP